MTDQILEKIAHYIKNYNSPSEEALKCARLCLADAIGCAMLALKFPECTRLLGPWVKGTIVPNPCRIPGTDLKLDPIMGAFNFGAMIRWLDFNDTFLAEEWAHPSDNIGALLPLMDHLSQNGHQFTVRDLLLAMIKAYEIQGGLALENSFNKVGIDHVILVKVAVAALSTQIMGGSQEQIEDAISQSFIDLGPLRAYRHAPNTGSRKSWAAGDAASRGLALSILTMRGEKGYQTPLTAPQYGLEDVLMPLKLSHSLGCYIIENILFKISYPAEFHAQTAVEAAIILHRSIVSFEDIESITITTNKAALRIIDKKGPLKNHADRDHCMQYMVACALIYGNLTADYYTDETAKDPRINQLREKIAISENLSFTEGYYHPDSRSIASSVAIKLKNGELLGPILVEYPLGHKKRRVEGIPLLFKKLEKNLLSRFKLPHVENLISLFQDQNKLERLPISEFMNFLVNH